jgi:hypothetical protein
MFSVTFYSSKRRGPNMDILEYPLRIGNRSDAVDLLDRVIEEVDDIAGSSASTGEISQWAVSIGVALELLRDAIAREIV